jgi:hypothetical protein
LAGAGVLAAWTVRVEDAEAEDELLSLGLLW